MFLYKKKRVYLYHQVPWPTCDNFPKTPLLARKFAIHFVLDGLVKYNKCNFDDVQFHENWETIFNIPTLPKPFFEPYDTFISYQLYFQLWHSLSLSVIKLKKKKLICFEQLIRTAINCNQKPQITWWLHVSKDFWVFLVQKIVTKISQKFRNPGPPPLLLRNS